MSSMVCIFWTLILISSCFECELITLLVSFQAKRTAAELGVLKSRFQQDDERRLFNKYKALIVLNIVYHLLKIVIPIVLVMT